LRWSAVTYIDDPGGYEIFYSTTSGGPYTLFETIADKSVETTTVPGLMPGTTYYFCLRTFTLSHRYNRLNDVYSEYTDEISETTIGDGSEPSIEETIDFFDQCVEGWYY
jgi:hypothetical protein